MGRKPTGAVVGGRGDGDGDNGAGAGANGDTACLRRQWWWRWRACSRGSCSGSGRRQRLASAGADCSAKHLLLVSPNPRMTVGSAPIPVQHQSTLFVLSAAATVVPGSLVSSVVLGAGQSQVRTRALCPGINANPRPRKRKRGRNKKHGKTTTTSTCDTCKIHSSQKIDVRPWKAFHKRGWGDDCTSLILSGS